MSTHPRAGQPAEPADLVDVARLVTAYYAEHPDPARPGPAGRLRHLRPPRLAACATRSTRTTSSRSARRSASTGAAQGIDGPLFLGRDTHALSEPALGDARWRCFAANGVHGARRQPGRLHADAGAVARDPRPTTAGGPAGLADGVVVTPSHNPPDDGGFKYNPPNGGPADTDVTRWIQDRANALLARRAQGGPPDPVRAGAGRRHHRAYDFLGAYVDDLPAAIDLDAIRDAGVRIGADPLGGASVAYWGEIAERHRLDLTVVNPLVDPTWRFMTLDWDGKIRMDCSSPYAMASLIANAGRLPDRHRQRRRRRPARHRHPRRRADEPQPLPGRRDRLPVPAPRPAGRPDAAVGKTLVSSSMIDRVAADLGRRLLEVPVGFKWFVPGLLDGSVGFGGEESAGASFLRRDGTVWTTDKDGILLCLLAVRDHRRSPAASPERALRRPGRERFGDPAYARIDAPATREEKAVLGKLSPEQVDRHRAGRRADHREADHRARQRRGDRRAQGDHRVRLVRRPAVRHRGRLQDLRRVLPGPRAPREDPGRKPKPW